MKELVDFARIIYPSKAKTETQIEIIPEDMLSLIKIDTKAGEYFGDVTLERLENNVVIFHGKPISGDSGKLKTLENQELKVVLRNCEIIVRNSDSTALNS